MTNRGTDLVVVPAHVWDRDDMRDALRARDFPAFFRIVRKYTGRGQGPLGATTGVPQPRISSYVTGKHAPTLETWQRIADGLQMPPNARQLLRVAQHAAVGQTAFLSPKLTTHGQDQPDPQRSVLPLEYEPIDYSRTTSFRIGPSTVEALHASIEDYWRRDDRYGSDALRPAVIGQLHYAQNLLREARGTQFSSEVNAATAELARLAGWMYFDGRIYNRARHYFTTSLQLAKADDDRPFISNVLSCLSLQATYEGKLSDALTFALAAQASSDDRATPRVKSALALREAFAHAAIGHVKECHAAIAEAERQYARANADIQDPRWVSYFDEQKLIVDIGIARARLGEFTEAEPLIDDAIKRGDVDNRRGRAFHGFWLATIQLLQGKLDHACHSARTAVTFTTHVDSARLAGHMEDFLAQLRPYHDEKCVQEFHEYVAATLGGQTIDRQATKP